MATKKESNFGLISAYVGIIIIIILLGGIVYLANYVNQNQTDAPVPTPTPSPKSVSLVFDNLIPLEDANYEAWLEYSANITPGISHSVSLT